MDGTVVKVLRAVMRSSTTSVLGHVDSDRKEA